MRPNNRVCLSCGRLLREGSNFCPHCGALLRVTHGKALPMKHERSFVEVVEDAVRLAKEQPEASSAVAIGAGAGGVILGPLAIAAGKTGMIAGCVATLAGALTENKSLVKAGGYLLGGGVALSASGYLITAAGGLSLVAGAGCATACTVNKIRDRRASRKRGP